MQLAKDSIRRDSLYDGNPGSVTGRKFCKREKVLQNEKTE